LCIYFVTDSWSVLFDPLQTHVLQHTRFPCPSLSSRACSNSCSSSRWCHPTTSSSVIPFSCLQSFSASGSFPVSQLFTSCGQRIGASGSASVLPMKSWLISLKIDWFDQVAVQGTLKSLIQPHNFIFLINIIFFRIKSPCIKLTVMIFFHQSAIKKQSCFCQSKFFLLCPIFLNQIFQIKIWATKLDSFVNF